VATRFKNLSEATRWAKDRAAASVARRQASRACRTHSGHGGKRRSPSMRRPRIADWRCGAPTRRRVGCAFKVAVKRISGWDCRCSIAGRIGTKSTVERRQAGQLKGADRAAVEAGSIDIRRAFKSGPGNGTASSAAPHHSKVGVQNSNLRRPATIAKLHARMIDVRHRFVANGHPLIRHDHFLRVGQSLFLRNSPKRSAARRSHDN